jgi:ketosteroid isomerase-like protein
MPVGEATHPGSSARAVVARARAGDGDAFALLVGPYRQGVHLHCYRMLGSLQDAEDLLQETLLRAWRALDGFEERSSFRGIELAFITAIQGLSPRQRAVLILRDALGFSARETAAMLDTSLASVNSALHRARTVVEARDGLNGEGAIAEREATLVASYVRAWEAADVDALVALLREDARMTMPPTPSWYLGREAIARFLASFFAGDDGSDTRLVQTGANRQPALAVFTRRPGDVYRPLALMVLTVEGGAIAAITGFADPRLFPYFGLAPDDRTAGIPIHPYRVMPDHAPGGTVVG